MSVVKNIVIYQALLTAYFEVDTASGSRNAWKYIFSDPAIIGTQIVEPDSGCMDNIPENISPDQAVFGSVEFNPPSFPSMLCIMPAYLFKEIIFYQKVIRSHCLQTGEATISKYIPSAL